MNLRSLTYFVAVAEELNITRAAKRLNMCQPPLSSQIKSLEEELNTVLFIRGKRHLQLTESGQLLYRRAREIINLTEKAESEIISMNEGMSGTISIGLIEGMVPDMAAEWFAGFINEHPHVKFRILDGNSDDLIIKLRGGLISLAVIASPFDQSLLNSFAVGHEHMVAIINSDHPLAQNGKDTVSVAELKGEKLIVPSSRAAIDMIYKWFRGIHSEPDIVCEMDSYLDAISLAGRNVGISIFPQTASTSNSSIVSKRIEGDNREIDYLFVWRKGHPLPSVEEAFIDYVKMRV